MTFHHTFHDVKFLKSEFKFRKRIPDFKILEKIFRKQIFEKGFEKRNSTFFEKWKIKIFGQILEICEKYQIFRRDTFSRFMKTTGIEKEHKVGKILFKLHKTGFNRIRHRSKNFYPNLDSILHVGLMWNPPIHVPFCLDIQVTWEFYMSCFISKCSLS